MARKNGFCRTIGYQSLTGEVSLFNKTLTDKKGKGQVSWRRDIELRAIERYRNGDWDVVDDFIFGDLKPLVEVR